MPKTASEVLPQLSDLSDVDVEFKLEFDKFHPPKAQSDVTPVSLL